MTDNPDRLLDDYREMRLIRCVEESLLDLKTAGEIPGSIHLCNGQEAIPVGACTALGPEDYVGATYRGHGWALARGVDVVQLVAEILGRDSALCGGRAASPFLSDPSVNFLGENSIVGAGVPIAMGAALSCRQRGRGVTMVSIGDGATNQGAVHEALNMAAVLALPAVVIVENNVYSEMSRIEDMVRVKQLAERGAAYGIPAVTIDGNDVAVVRAECKRAVARARRGDGPTIIEAMTERLVGHYSGDVQHYRPKGEVEDARSREPLVVLRNRAGARWAAELDAIDADIGRFVAAAIEEARAMPEPDATTVKDHTYA